MIKQLQMGFKLLKYTHGIATNIASLILIFVIGTYFELLPVLEPGIEHRYIINVGSYFIMMSALFILQMLISLNVPNVVAVSPWKKRIQTSVFALMVIVSYGITFLPMLGMKYFKYSSGILTYSALVEELMLLPVMTILTIVYMAVALKYFVASTVIFFIILPVVMGVQAVGPLVGWFSYAGISLGMAIALCVAAIFLGAALSYGVLCLLYKKPVSKYSQNNSLKKKM